MCNTGLRKQGALEGLSVLIKLGDGAICLKCLVWLIALFCRRRSRRKGLLLVLSMVVYEMKYLCQVVEVCASIGAMYCDSYSFDRGFDSYLGLFQGVLARCIRTGYCDFEPEVLRTALVKTSEWVEEVCDENIGEERDSGYRTFFFVS